ncbi:hypothetical protein K0B96_09580 [Horticoccus luteus]|uniref:Uncharacterized protein n=1 Tax=Horticoccus luteus TaxID=2862869 RepID=A0A8F9TSP4_9BACT|nr:hypothetical protein [Horticoccus luteus]QYM77578.1 hypothetical protein K0B96_09580 [Horticoccus luteus]
MTLSPEQQTAVASWVSAGDNLSAIQKKLTEQFNLSLTYMDVRFLVDDLNLALKDPAPKADANDVGKASPAHAAPSAAPEKKGFLDKAKEKLGLGKEPAPTESDDGFADDELPPEDLADSASSVTVSVDKISLIPGALASGSVKFSDGVTGKWIIDNQGRPGFTEVSQPGYRPNPTDAQAFMAELGRALQQRGY